MLQMKKLFIYFTCFLCLVGCQKNDIQVHNGQNTSLNKLDGSWVVINYWADWCPPCLKEMPELVEFSNQNSDINVFAFNFDQLDIEDLDPQIKRFGVDIPSLISYPGEIWGIESPQTLPATYFINENGKVVRALFKPQTLETLNDVLSEVRDS